MESNQYLKGEKLIGDDFSLREIEKWYKDETEAYADLGSNETDKYVYEYHNINIVHGFNKLDKNKIFNKVLGIGAAYGNEFEPILDRIKEIHILEPSDQLISDNINGLKPIYKKPSVSGQIDYPDNTFDLITCFGVLHHIPNVTYIMSELYRILKPGGQLLVREPIISMGDWNFPRKGLTKRERGIPLKLFNEMISKIGFKVKSSSYCFALSSFLHRKIGHLLKKPIYAYLSYVYFDKIVSTLFAWNLRYHATKPYQRIAPQNIYFVLEKKSL
jgi:SAM-dependent methyltransferase